LKYVWGEGVGRREREEGEEEVGRRERRGGGHRVGYSAMAT